MSDQGIRARSFAALHRREGVFIMPNAWDAGSARILAAAGFEAIGTTSGGVNWSAGRRDYVYEVPAGEMLAVYEKIGQAVDLPVSADLENGYGAAPEAVADTVARAVRAGMAGGGIEDWTGDARTPLYDIDLAVERIAAARRAADETGMPFTLTARCEAFFTGHEQPFDEVVRRCQLFREAGADCVFAPGLSGAEAIARFVREVDCPVNMVAGLAAPRLSAMQLADLGVKRISTGGSLARAVFGKLRRAARELAQEGTFDYLDGAIDDGDMNGLFR